MPKGSSVKHACHHNASDWHKGIDRRVPWQTRVVTPAAAMPPESTASTRGGRGARTRQRIAQVALELFREHGYDDVTTVDIARAAGINPRTYFRHFATKADVVFVETERTTRGFINALYGGDPHASLIEVLTRVIIDQSAESLPTPDDIERYHLVHATPALTEESWNRQREFESHLIRWIAQRTQRSEMDFDVRVLAAALVATRRVVVEEVVRSGAGLPDAEQLVHRALSIFEPVFD